MRFLALAASCSYIDSSRELIVLDIKEMNYSATAEAIKECIESMVQQFDFDKLKIKGNVQRIDHIVITLYKLKLWYLMKAQI